MNRALVILCAAVVLLLTGAGVAGPAVLAQIPTPTALPPATLPNPTPPANAREVPFHDNTGKLVKPPFRTLADFNSEMNRVAVGSDPTAFWNAVIDTQQMPLVFGNTAVFLYRGKARTVEWRGDFTRWNSLPPLRGRRLGTSDIWLAIKTFPLDARLDYKIVIDSTRQILDPLNPFTQTGGYGRNSVIRMPDYVYPALTLPQKDAAKGKVSEAKTIGSQYLKYVVRYFVYTPPGYEKLDKLPVIYVTDGQEYANPEMGALPVVIDNLLAQKAIRPVVAVFVDARDPQSGQNRRGPELLTNDRYEKFMMRELIPEIETSYRVSRKMEDRALLGASLGGLRGTWAITQYPNVWGMAALQSPYFKAKPRVLAQFAEAPRVPTKVFVNQGTYDLDVEGTRFFRDVLKQKGYEHLYIETNDGHSYGNWRGALDEMLVFFFGVGGL